MSVACQIKERPITLRSKEIVAILDGTRQFNRQIAARWKRAMSEGGKPCWKTSWATVWDDGLWFTWDKNGVGGENWREESLYKAQQEAMDSAIRQGFVHAPYEVGERLWVREPLAKGSLIAGRPKILYDITRTPMAYHDGCPEGMCGAAVWQWDATKLSAGEMPRWAARITLEVVGVEPMKDVPVNGRVPEHNPWRWVVAVKRC